MAIEPLAVGVCSWSLQVKSVPELKSLLGRLGIDVVQIACGDPHHASWEEGDAMPAAARAAGFRMTGAMLGRCVTRARKAAAFGRCAESTAQPQ